MYKVKLTRKTTRYPGQGLRTDSVDGVSDALPVIGSGFGLIGSPLDKDANLRSVHTSPVVSVEHIKHGELRFHTLNSEYMLEYSWSAD